MQRALQPAKWGILGWPAGRGLLLVCALALCLAGCTRHWFRKQADKEVDCVLKEKDRYPAWAIEQYHPYPDPRARFADPTNPDRPPMPPDDPAAASLSPHPQKVPKAGIALVSGTGYLDLLAQWDAENRAGLDKGKQKQPGCGSPDRPFLINLEQSMELGLINSREFQDRRENLYMTSLAVTLQRFALSAQFFAVERAFQEWAGRNTPDGPVNQFNSSAAIGFSKLFSTGALLVFHIANQTIVDFTKMPDFTTSTSNISLDLMQPLLRGGGRAVTLEPLTQAERDLVYEIRSYARFRKEFYVSIAGGGGGSISGGVFSPSGVIALSPYSPTAGLGNSGLFPGLVPGVDAIVDRLQNTPGASGRLQLGNAIAAPVTGYLPTLLQAGILANDRQNVTELEEILKLFQAFKEGGGVSQLQVDQVEQQLLNGRSTVLNDEQSLRNALDNFNLQLGLAPNLSLELDDAPLRDQTRQMERFNQIFRQLEAARNQAEKYGAAEEAASLRGRLGQLLRSDPLVQGTPFQRNIGRQWDVWQKLTDQEASKAVRERLARLGEERRRLLDRQADLEKQGKALPAADRRRLTELDFEIDLGNFERSLRIYEQQSWKGVADPARRRRQQQALFRDVHSAVALVLGEARNERLDQLRQSWPALPPVIVDGIDLLGGDQEEAQAVVARTALQNRLDLMNVRAQLVDAWRQIAIFANALLGVVNVEYHFETFTPPLAAKPFAFGGSGNRNTLRLDASLPLVRKSERNNYRAALIAFQRQRRTLMEGEDLVLSTVRSEIRQLRLLADNYRIQQRQVELAYLSRESALDTFQAPPGAGATINSAATAAALTQQLLGAQASLPSAQNGLLRVYISYLTFRLQLYRDLELMPLDARGVWLDELGTASRGAASNPPAGGDRLPAPRPLPVPAEQAPRHEP